MILALLIAAVSGYLLGALPFGYLVARGKGVNIFEVGSKNPGATNVRRVLGHGPGNLVLFLDAAKGALAAGLFPPGAVDQDVTHRLGRRGARVLCVPSAFTERTGKAHWEVLLRARAIENLCYVAGVNRIGRDGKLTDTKQSVEASGSAAIVFVP